MIKKGVSLLMALALCLTLLPICPWETIVL